MPLTTFVGSFTVPAATGNKAITGLGFQPKAVFFWGNRRSADGATGAAPNHECAFYTGIALSSSSRVVVGNDDDGAADTGSYESTSLCIKQQDNGSVNFAADFVSMDADGFTINFSTANATAYVVNFMALGGSDLSNVAIKSITTPTATGNQATTGVGFQPDCLLLIAQESAGFGGTAAIGQTIGFGFSSTQRGEVTTTFDGSVNTSKDSANNKIFRLMKDSGLIRRDADLVSLDSDGFTLNWTTVNAATQTVYALCLKGGKYFVGSLTQKTSTGSQSTTGVGFQPTGLLLLSAGNTGSAQTHLGMMIGGASGPSNRAMVFYQSGTDGVAGLDRAAVIADYGDNTTPTVNSKADLTSLDADGFTLNYSTADASARVIVFLAFGNTTAPFVPASVFPPLRDTRPFPFLPGGPGYLRM